MKEGCFDFGSAKGFEDRGGFQNNILWQVKYSK
jgi:hypothetical protein